MIQLAEATAKPNAIMVEPRYSGFRVYAYGPVRVSSAFLRTYPAAYALSHTPGTTSRRLSSNVFQVGCANHRNTPAKTNPSGTRMRRAIFCHLVLSLMPVRSHNHLILSGPQQLKRRLDDLIGRDLHQPLL